MKQFKIKGLQLAQKGITLKLLVLEITRAIHSLLSLFKLAITNSMWASLCHQQ
jgi:hypothetical protein